MDKDAGNGCRTLSYEAKRSRFDQVIDCSLLLVAIVIGAELALTSIGPTLLASPVETEELYVNRFSIVSELNSEALSAALQIELQYEVARLPNVRVVVPTDSKDVFDGWSLNGSVTVGDTDVQITTIVVSNRSGELAWSDVLRISIKDSGGTPRSMAKSIVSALESWSTVELGERSRDD